MEQARFQPADPSAQYDLRQQGRRQIALLWGAVSLALVLLSPLGSWLAGGLPNCPFKSWTGLPCPTCGTTRAALTLAEFRPLDALLNYPLPTAAWLFFLIGGGVAAALAISGRPLPGLPRRVPLWGQVLLLAALVLNWLYSWQTGV